MAIRKREEFADDAGKGLIFRRITGQGKDKELVVILQTEIPVMPDLIENHRYAMRNADDAFLQKMRDDARKTIQGSVHMLSAVVDEIAEREHNAAVRA